MQKIYNIFFDIKRWLSTTNHTDIGICTSFLKKNDINIDQHENEEMNHWIAKSLEKKYEQENDLIAKSLEKKYEQEIEKKEQRLIKERQRRKKIEELKNLLIKNNIDSIKGNIESLLLQIERLELENSIKEKNLEEQQNLLIENKSSNSIIFDEESFEAPLDPFDDSDDSEILCNKGKYVEEIENINDSDNTTINDD